MIAYLDGVCRGPGDSPGTALVETEDGSTAVIVVGENGGLHEGAPVLVARGDVTVGARHLHRTVFLGTPEERRPLDPSGLASTPVVVVEPTWVELAAAGARRSGRDATIVMVAPDQPRLALRLLVAVADGAEVLLVPDGGSGSLWLARVLGGRSIAAVPFGDRAAMRRLFVGLDVDVHVPVPSGDEEARAAASAAAGTANLVELHHLVDVDPAPAFAELGVDQEASTLDALAAAAAGVLAGRLAAGNRPWRGAEG